MMLPSQYQGRVLFCLLWLALALQPTSGWSQTDDWSFTVAGEMRRYVFYQDIHGWDQACAAMAAVGPGAFMVSPGDLDQQYTSNPGDYVYQIVEQEIAPGFPFFAGVGNHEYDDVETMDWIRNCDHGGPEFALNPGPAGSENTTYSWDKGNAHFVMLNECFDGVNDMGSIEGNWNPELDAWLNADLAANDRALTFVFGHFPAFPQPDRDTGVQLHMNDTDFNMVGDGVYRDALWSILVDYGVTAYVCGHSHASSAVQIEGVWQIDLGHARGPRDQNWHGPSTFLRFLVGADQAVVLETWRQPYTSGAGNEAPYTLWHIDQLREGVTTPVQDASVAALLVGARPNPFNPQTTISWQQPSAGLVNVDVYDVAGRRIASLVDRYESEGEHSVVWDGCDNNGSHQAAGVYLAGVRQAGVQEVLKLILVP